LHKLNVINGTEPNWAIHTPLVLTLITDIGRDFQLGKLQSLRFVVVVVYVFFFLVFLQRGERLQVEVVALFTGQH
jgi:hypothetical protein